MWYRLDPEVSASLGDRTVIEGDEHPPIVTHLHLEFAGWLGDDLIETFPVFAVTSRLRDAMVAANLSGVIFDILEQSVTDEFLELYPSKDLPMFHWMKVLGTAGEHDFATGQRGMLIASPASPQLLRSFSIEHCDIEIVG